MSLDVGKKLQLGYSMYYGVWSRGQKSIHWVMIIVLQTYTCRCVVSKADSLDRDLTISGHFRSEMHDGRVTIELKGKNIEMDDSNVKHYRPSYLEL